MQVLPLPAGMYLFSVKAAAASTERSGGNLNLPALHVGLGPGVRSEQVEFLAGPGTDGAWLFAHGDVLVAKVNRSGATLVLTSVRASNGDVLGIEVERLEGRLQATGTAPTESLGTPIKLPLAAADEASARTPPQPAATRDPAQDLAIPLQIKTHIRSRGDMNFADVPWAGRVAPGLWIESFSVLPHKHLGARHIEYKGLTGTGFETPWLSDDQICGTKGMAVPLVGFAIRLKPGAETAGYDCEYSGYYQSGATVGPMRNGAPCRSTVANDPLEGIQIRIIQRPKAAGAPAKLEAQRIESPRSSIKAPTFGRYRDGEAASGNGASKPAAPKHAKPLKPGDAPVRANGTRSAQRSQNRSS
jgi:hypothetical protein